MKCIKRIKWISTQRVHKNAAKINPFLTLLLDIIWFTFLSACNEDRLQQRLSSAGGLLELEVHAVFLTLSNRFFPGLPPVKSHFCDTIERFKHNLTLHHTYSEFTYANFPRFIRRYSIWRSNETSNTATRDFNVFKSVNRYYNYDLCETLGICDLGIPNQDSDT